jgi:RHS repeat-associated protein
MVHAGKRWLSICAVLMYLVLHSTAAIADSNWCWGGSHPDFAAAWRHCVDVMDPTTRVNYKVLRGCHNMQTPANPPDIQGAVVETVDNNGLVIDPWGVGNQYFCWGAIKTPAPGKSNGCPGCNAGVADPINAGTGNVYRREEDFRAGKWLSFERYYNSSTTADSGALGNHWLHGYERRITYDATQNLVRVRRADGRVDTYVFVQGAWSGETDLFDALTWQKDSAGTPTGWTLTNVSTRSLELYDGRGNLVGIQDPEGFNVVLSYSTASTPISQAPGPGYLISVSDPQGRAITFTYDAQGHLIQVKDPNGSAYGYAVDAAGNLQEVAYPDGKAVTYLYNEPSNNGGSAAPALLTGIMDEATGRYISYGYNAAGQAISNFQGVGASAYTITYNADGSSDVVDPLGTSRKHTFITVAGVSHAQSIDGPCASCSKESSWVVNFRGKVTQSTDRKGNVTIYQHDMDGMETGRIEAYGSAMPRPVETDWNDSFHVPTERRVLNSAYNLITKTNWLYNNRGQEIVRCDYDANVSGALNYLCSATGVVPAGVRRTVRIYCDVTDSEQCPLVGLSLSVDGPRTDVSDITQYGYYSSSDESGCGTTGGACHRAGDVYQIIDAAGHVTTYVAYDKNGRITRQRDANGILTDFTYHPRGWLLTRTVRANTDGTSSSNDAVTQIGYTPYGAVASVTDPDGVKVTYTYDAAHRLTDITDALGNRIHYTLDAAGNKTKEETFDTGGTLRRSLGRSYNTLGQLTGIKDGLNRTVFDASFSDSYDANGNLVRSADALGIQRKQGYDALNRLITTIDNYNGTDTATQNTQSVFAYDARDQLQGVSDPDGLNTTYDYDGLGNTTAVHSPDTGTSIYAYDAAGNRVQAKDARGIVSNSTYDALNRITATTYPHSDASVSYRYDEPDSVTGCAGSYPIGRLTSIVETAVTTVYCYDARGNVVKKTQTQGTNVDTVSYTYTLADRLASTRTPDGTAIQYGRDGAGRINAVAVLPPGTNGAGASNVVTNVSYLPFGPIASYTLGNGQTITRTYDANYAVTDVVSPALNLHFARDAMGNITALGNAPGATPAIETYSYDPLYRLTGLKDAQGQAIEAYTYNKTGDRLSKTANGLATGTYGYQAGTHWLTSIGNSARAYDASGNTTGSAVGGDTFGYGYNDRNRMVLVQRNGQTVASYTYNVTGQRIAKAAPGNQRFAYDEGSQLLGEYGAISRSYVWLGTSPIAVVETNGGTTKVSYVHADGLGAPRAVTDSSGNAVWQWGYQANPFGEKVPSAAGLTFNLRYPGQYYDAESGLVSNVNRDYEAAIGRYIQSDPVGLGGGWNSYSYVASNPLAYIDPLGTQLVVPVPEPRPVPPVMVPDLPQQQAPGIHEGPAERCLALGAICQVPMGINGALMSGGSSNVIPFPRAKPKTSDNCPPPGDGCSQEQMQLLATYFEKASLLRVPGMDVISKRNIAAAFNAKATDHNIRCPSHEVPLLDMPRPTGVF